MGFKVTPGIWGPGVYISALQRDINMPLLKSQNFFWLAQITLRKWVVCWTLNYSLLCIVPFLGNVIDLDLSQAIGV